MEQRSCLRVLRLYAKLQLACEVCNLHTMMHGYMMIRFAIPNMRFYLFARYFFRAVGLLFSILAGGGALLVICVREWAEPAAWMGIRNKAASSVLVYVLCVGCALAGSVIDIVAFTECRRPVHDIMISPVLANMIAGSISATANTTMHDHIYGKTQQYAKIKHGALLWFAGMCILRAVGLCIAAKVLMLELQIRRSSKKFKQIV